ncbi:MAG: DUF3551 domain-containing protein [Pseudolabrys sp.]|nr:DUF3551 domain-containing protein [Pseudolabrys sp.]
MKKLMLGTLIFGAALAAQTGSSWAYGSAPWCASYNTGGGNYLLECYYRTVDECSRTIIAGNRGQCLQNPEFNGYVPPPRRRR